MSDQSPIGEAFVFKRPDGSIGGEGQYCGFAIEMRLDPDERDGQRGYRVMIFNGRAPASPEAISRG